MINNMKTRYLLTRYIYLRPWPSVRGYILEDHWRGIIICDKCLDKYREFFNENSHLVTSRPGIYTCELMTCENIYPVEAPDYYLIADGIDFIGVV